MAHDIEISFFAGKKSENFCAGSITERRTWKVTETQKKYFLHVYILLLARVSLSTTHLGQSGE